MADLKLYHTGFLVIREPDLKHGRKNADFGQGFYLSPDLSFSRRWAVERKGETTYINHYVLHTDGLKIREMERDSEWFSYIFANRNGVYDTDTESDVIIGPIANDTIFDTMGIFTSGFLNEEEALKLLRLGPCYRQVVIRSEKAKQALEWTDAEMMSGDEIAQSRATVLKEGEAYLAQVAENME